jgi:hypothetical protein
MESAGLEWFAELGIIIFMSVFILIGLRLVFMKKDEAEDMGRIPLDDAEEIEMSDNEVAA